MSAAFRLAEHLSFALVVVIGIGGLAWAVGYFACFVLDRLVVALGVWTEFVAFMNERAEKRAAEREKARSA